MLTDAGEILDHGVICREQFSHLETYILATDNWCDVGIGELFQQSRIHQRLEAPGLRCGVSAHNVRPDGADRDALCGRHGMMYEKLKTMVELLCCD